MKIVQVAPYATPHVGGVESHVETVSAELARRGHDVTLLTSRLEGSPSVEAGDGYVIRRVKQSANLFTTPVTPAIGAALDELSPELVHAHSPPPLSSYFTSRWTKRRGVPFVLTYHCDLELTFPGGAALVELYRRTFGRATVRAADALVATTRTYAQTSRALWSRSDVHVVPNCVDTERFSPDVGPGDAARVRRRHMISPSAPIALFVGRLTHHKGIEEFLRSAEGTGDVVHLIVGDGPKREALEAMAQASSARKRIVFAGRVASEDLPAYYRAASVGVLPSTSRLEAFGIAALECMASGRPVVVSAMPGVTEVIEPDVTGVLAEPLDAADLAKKIVRVAHDPELASSMGKAARARVLERYTLAAVADELEDVYASVLAKAS